MDEGDLTVGVVGDGAADLADAVRTADWETIAGSPTDVLAADPDVVVARGERAVSALARERPDPPLVPVDAGRGVRSVPSEEVPAALERFRAGDRSIETHPILSVERDGDRLGRALFDVSLVTNEVARISEYSVASGDTAVGQFRADGVVVAAPAGSTGYASRVGAGILAPETDVAAVAPIAPFATDPDHWVVPLEGVALGVERDEVSVTLLADDREVARVGEGDRVTVRTDGTLSVAVLPQSRRRFPAADGG